MAEFRKFLHKRFRGHKPEHLRDVEVSFSARPKLPYRSIIPYDRFTIYLSDGDMRSHLSLNEREIDLLIDELEKLSHRKKKND